MLNLIIGKSSNLSSHLEQKLDKTILISSQSIADSLSKIDFKIYSSINIIFNQFQVSTKLVTLDEPTTYISRSIDSTAIVLEYIQKNNITINKIIYTSSSSVYGNNIACDELQDTNPLSLHSSLKYANEKLIELFCSTYKIDYSIVRIFNMYGGDDKFSIISKIIKIYKNNEVLNLINNGEAIRDFIHIDDVVQCYMEILKVREVPIINIGTSEGKSILYMLDFLRKNKIDIKTKNIYKDELKVSVSKNKILLDILGGYSFKKVEEYLLDYINKLSIK